MVNDINFKFYKDLKGIKIILVPCNVIILNNLNKTVKTNLLMLLAEISTLLHPPVKLCYVFVAQHDVS